MDEFSYTSSDAFYKAKGEIRVKDLESCPDPLRNIVNELVNLQLNNGHAIDKKTLDAFRKEDQGNRVREELKVLMKTYVAPMYNQAELNHDNRLFSEENRLNSGYERGENRKINDEIVKLADGTSSGYSYRLAARVKLRFEGLLPRDAFRNLTQYYMDIDGTKTILTIPTLKEFMKKAGDMGLSKSTLPEALKIFAEQCIPRVAGSLSLRGADLPKTLGKILNSINPKREKLMLEQKLKRFKRAPNEAILTYVEPFYELFEAYSRVDRVYDLTKEESFEEEKRNFNFLKIALRALLSEGAQRAVVRALKELQTDPTREIFEAIVAECDYKSPLTAPVTLPGSLSMLEGSLEETQLFAVLEESYSQSDYMAPGFGLQSASEGSGPNKRRHANNGDRRDGPPTRSPAESPPARPPSRGRYGRERSSNKRGEAKTKWRIEGGGQRSRETSPMVAGFERPRAAGDRSLSPRGGRQGYSPSRSSFDFNRGRSRSMTPSTPNKVSRITYEANGGGRRWNSEENRSPSQGNGGNNRSFNRSGSGSPRRGFRSSTYSQGAKGSARPQGSFNRSDSGSPRRLGSDTHSQGSKGSTWRQRSISPRDQPRVRGSSRGEWKSRTPSPHLRGLAYRIKAQGIETCLNDRKAQECISCGGLHNHTVCRVIDTSRELNHRQCRLCGLLHSTTNHFRLERRGRDGIGPQQRNHQ